MINQAAGCFLGSLASIAFVCAGLDGRDRRIGLILCFGAAAIFAIETLVIVSYGN